MIRLLLAATSLLALSQASFAADGDPFYGYAYDLQTGKYLYTEVHQPKFEGGKEISSLIRYFTPEGTLIGKKPLDYRSNYFVPTFRFDLLREGYTEGISSNKGSIEMFKVAGKGKEEKRATVEVDGVTAADSGFNHLVQSVLPKVMAGETVPFHFAVAGELTSFKFRIKKVGDGSFEGKPAVKLLVQADSLLRFVAPDLQLLYDAASKHLLEYKGVSNVHDPVSGKAYLARIAYFSTPPADAPKNLPPFN